MSMDEYRKTIRSGRRWQWFYRISALAGAIGGGEHLFKLLYDELSLMEILVAIVLFIIGVFSSLWMMGLYAVEVRREELLAEYQLHKTLKDSIGVTSVVVNRGVKVGELITSKDIK